MKRPLTLWAIILAATWGGVFSARAVNYLYCNPPLATTPPASQTLCQGQPAIFTVVAEGDTPLTYQWQKQNGSSWVTVYDSSTVSGAATHTLTISAVVSNDAGAYRVSLVNACASTNSASATLTVNATPPPISGLPTNTIGFLRGDPPVLITKDGTASFTDTVASGGSLRVAFTDDYMLPGDLLSINNQGIGAGQIGVSGTNVSYGGTTIGTFSGGTNQQPLVVAFTTNPTTNAVNALLNNLTYYFPSNECMIPVRDRSLALTLADSATACFNSAACRPLSVACLNAVDVMLVIDHSGSMGNDVPGTKLKAAKDAAISFVNDLQMQASGTSDHAGVVKFDDTVVVMQSLTTNRTAVSNQIASITNNNGNTALGDAVYTTRTNYLASSTPRYMVLLTDGIQTAGTHTPVTEATNAQTINHVHMITIGLGDDVNESELSQMASPNPWRTSTNQYENGRDYYKAQTNTVAAVYAQIAGLLCRGNHPPYVKFHRTAPLNYVENDSATLLDPNFELLDPDSTLNGGYLTISLMPGAEAPDLLEIANTNGISLSGTTVSYNSQPIGTLNSSGGQGTNNLVVTFTNVNATATAAQALMRAVTYRNASDSPSTGSRTVQVVANDGAGGCHGGDSLPTTMTINIGRADDAPKIQFVSTNLNYTENMPATILATNATVSDVDSANFDTGKLTVDFSANGQSQDQLAISHEGTGAGQIGVSGTNVSYGGTTMGSITTGPGTTKLVVSLNSYASTNAVQALLRRVTYWNSSDNPSTLVRTVRAGVSDGDGAVSAATTMTVTVIAVNDPPVVQFVTPSLNYTENNAPTILATNATVSDIDSANFNTGTLTVAIATNALPEDQLNISSEDPGTGINVSDTNVFSGTTQIGTITTGPGMTTLVVTFNSSASPAVTQALLRRVTYWNSSDNPSTLVRTVRAVVIDGSSGISDPTTMTVTITPVNDPPVIQFVTPSLSYTQNYAATILATNATVTDVDSTNFNTGTLTVNFATNGLPEDQLGISSQGPSPGQIGVSGTNVSYGGTVFGTLTTGPGTNTLVVSLNANASTNAVQALLRRVTYWNSSSNPSTLVRTVQAVLTDGGIGGTSAPTTMTVTLTLVIAPPAVHMVNPTDNQIFALSPTNILLVATATNAAGASITNVEFYTNNVWLGEATPVSNQWQFLWLNVLPGTNRITAWATNSSGLFAPNSATNVIVNAMPLVAITFPTNSTSTNLTTFRAPTNLVLRATASDPHGTNLTVQFFYRTNTDSGAFWTNFTYSATRTNGTNFFLTWSNCPADTHAIYALATDGRGASSASDLIVFQVTPTNPPPSVWITWPTNGASFPAGATITITAMASNSPAGGYITNVEFFADTRLLGNDTNSPYSLTECCWKSGKFVLRAKASDNLGASGISEAVEIVVAKDAPVGDGFWDAEFSKGSLSALPRFVTATGLGVADGGTVYAGSFYDCSVEATADGTNWAELITWPYMFGDIYAITPVGTNIYAGGFWRSVEYYLGRWDGTSWHSVGNRFTQGNLLPTVLAIAEMGGDLYVAGDFISAGTNPTNPAVQRVARLNPQTDEWQPVGNGLTNGTVYAMTVLGGELYIGGTFTNAGGNPQANYVARLCGNVWTNLSGGVSDGGGSAPWVAALAVSGTNLFVGGNFRAAGAQTNANGIACWNTVDWRSLNGGIGALEPSAPMNTLPEGPLHVYALAACDNRVFVGGQFTNVLMGANSLAANNIAMATWSEADQSWSWSDLDGGVALWSDYGDQPSVFRSVLVPGATSGSFDLYVGGEFNRVGSGQLASGCVARWRLGRSRPPGPPSLTITNPAPNAVITNSSGADIPLAASARSSYTNIAAVEFFVDGLSVGGQINQDGSCGASWSSPLPGAHLLAASVTDGAGLQGEAKPIVVTIRDPNNSVTAVSDRFAVLMNTPPANLDVLTNDASSTSSPLRLVNVLPVSAGCGTARISHDGRYVIYQPRVETCGTDLFLYSVTDGHNTNTAYATVRVLSHPVITMTSPDASVASCLWNGPIKLLIGGLATDYDGTVTNVAISLDGSPWNHTNSSSFGFLWTNGTAGFYTFSIVATDNDGLSNKLWMLLNIYETNVVNGVTAHILNLDPTPNDLVDGIPYLIREGLFLLQGEARDSNANHLVSYQLQLLRPEDNLDPEAEPVIWANVTPGPLNDAGFHLGSDSSGSLGRLDFSGIPNGTYDLKLVVHGGGNEATDIKRFRLDTQLKIGQFSFTEQDLVIPVSGIPLTVTRTYSSLNLRPADFGYGWSYSLMGMDVQLDDQRQDVTIGGNDAPFADDEDSDTGLPRVVNIRTGGGWDVTLTLPDGRRTTFAFIPTLSPSACKAYAHWTAPPDVHATLKPLGAGEDVINMLPLSQAYWQQSDNTYAPSTFDNHDISGWVLETQDGTQYRIERGNGNNVVWADDPLGNPGHYISVQAYGPPKLTSILQRSGDTIEIRDNGIFHYAGGTHLTRSVLFDRDSQGRITAIRDPNSGSTGLPVLKYVYHSENGNLLQVLKLTDRAAGTYLTTKYRYDQPRFPHYITSIENPLGVPIARNEYDDSGRLTAVVDADGQRTEFHHNITNDVEVVIDRLGHTNTYSYDSRGNVTNTINALNGITRMTYDDNNNKTNEVAFLNGQPYATNSYVFDARSLLLVSVNPLGYSNVFSYNDFGQVLTSTDARGNTSTNYYDSQTGNLLGTSGALGNSTTNFYDPNGTSLLFGSRDAIGTLSTNYYDVAGNLTATAIWDASGILSTNSFTYDNNGNRTNSTVSRRVAGTWTNAMTTYIYDGQNRLVRTIEPDGGTNTVVYNEVGKQARTIDKLGRVTSYEHDAQGRLFRTTYPDQTTETSNYDSAGNRTNSVDRAGRSTTYVFDALNRLTQTIFPDITTNRTIYDGLSRVQFSVDARETTNAFGYDVAGQRVAVTNAWGVSAVQIANGFVFDANGNQITATDPLGRTTTNVFDALNRLVQVSYVDGTKTATGYDSVGHRVAETNQDGIITRFGYDGTGRLTSVTNAFGKTEQMVTRYEYDEAANLLRQIDALNRTNSFAYDALGRRIAHTMPDLNLVERFSYDYVGNLVYQTNFSGAVITNQYDLMNRLTNRASVNGYKASFAYSLTGQRTNMADANGTTSYSYDNRDRLQLKTVAWSGGPTRSLNYRFDANGNLTNLWSSTTGGVTNLYQFDALNRLTNVLANGSAAASYGFDTVGNLRSVRYGNGVTNQFQYDALDRLTNALWKLNASTLASFYYQLGLTGNRTNLSEAVNSTSRTYAWAYDSLYRLKQETLGGGTSGTLSYSFDPVGNRTNRTVTGSLSLTNQSFTYNTNDWLTGDSYDKNGNTTNSSGTPYQFDALNHLTNVNSGAVLITYDGDGNRLRKTVGGANTFYLLDDRNLSGYVQVLEEWTASGGTTNLSRVYNYGLQLISQRQPNASTNYFAFDGHGSTRVLTDNGGSVVNAFTFDAYGNLIASNIAPQTVYLYCGEQWDPDLGMYCNRARYFNPGTGRFWTMDSFEGDQETPATLHKYLYGLGSPIDNRDPSGNEVEANLTSMDIFSGLGSMQTTAIGSSPRAFLSASPYGHGGPDVTGILKRTLDEVGDFFGHLDGSQPVYAGSAIRYRGAGNNWEIYELRNLAPEMNFLSFPGLAPKSKFECGTGLFKTTVAVSGEVYDASAVNYAIYGKMSRLVYDWYKAHNDPVDASLFSLSVTKAWVKAYKRLAMPAVETFLRFNPTAPDTSYETGYMAEAFAAWGYNGSQLPRGLRTTSSGDVVNASTFEWRWMPYHP